MPSSRSKSPIRPYYHQDRGRVRQGDVNDIRYRPRRSYSRSRSRSRSRSFERTSRSPHHKRHRHVSTDKPPRRASTSRSRERKRRRDSHSRSPDDSPERPRHGSPSDSVGGSSRRRKEKHKRRRSRSHERRKEKKREKKEKKRKAKGSASHSSWGKHGIISETDIFRKDQEFRTWLVEERKINPETISKDQERKEFAHFVEDFNTATLPHEKYYNMEAYERRMSALRQGEYLPPADDLYDFNADMKAVTNSHKKKSTDQETYMTREQLMELRKVQQERTEIGRMKLLGMDVKQNFGVRMDTTYE